VALVDVDPVPLPCWLTDRLADPEPVLAVAGTSPVRGNATAYAAAALRGELDRVLVAVEGSRNHTLNAAAFALGQLTAAGMLPRQLAEDALMLAGQAIGLSARECTATIRSGIDSGERSPRQLTSRDPQRNATPHDDRPAA
jgi:hypothetical protein